MKKSYSKLNILQERLSPFSEGKGFFKHMVSTRRYITVIVPYYDYLRGKIFVNDMKETLQDEILDKFDFGLLIYLLYDDFCNQIKRGAKNEQVAQFLNSGKQKYFKKKVVQKRVMKPLTTHVFEFETIEKEEEENEAQDEKKAYIELRMKESEVLRSEVLIHDLEPYMTQGEGITVEELIAIVYLDFMDNIKREGNSLKVQKSILAHLKRF